MTDAAGDGLIITVAPTGAEVDQMQTPHLPISPDEIADEVARAVDAGAAVAHLHARLPDGTPTTAPNVLDSIILKIRERAGDVIINLSTGGEVGMTVADRKQVLECDTEVASLNMGSLNFGDGIFENPVPLIKQLAKEMKTRGIVAELETYELGMLHTAEVLVTEQLIAERPNYNFVLGTAGGAPAVPAALDLFVRLRIPGSPWFATGIGRSQMLVAAESIVRGGHVRVGLEDNIYLDRGLLATSNAQLVERAAELGLRLGRKVLDAAESRRVLGIPALADTAGSGG